MLCRSQTHIIYMIHVTFDITLHDDWGHFRVGWILSKLCFNHGNPKRCCCCLSVFTYLWRFKWIVCWKMYCQEKYTTLKRTILLQEEEKFRFSQQVGAQHLTVLRPCVFFNLSIMFSSQAFNHYFCVLVSNFKIFKYGKSFYLTWKKKLERRQILTIFFWQQIFFGHNRIT